MQPGTVNIPIQESEARAASEVRNLTPLQFVSRHWRGALLVVLGVSSLLGVILTGRRNQQPESFGQIYIDSPEVYTRERLLNDRFMQGEWLELELKRGDLDFGIQGAARRSESASTTSSTSVGAPGAAPVASGAPAAPAATSAAPALRQSPTDIFRDGLAYREEVRSEIIENQLDDRHDADGSTLYRLKFDVTLVPGTETTARAIVWIRLSSPLRLVDPDHAPPAGNGEGTFPQQLLWLQGEAELLQQLDDLRGMYARWLEQLSQELNQSLVECREEIRARINFTTREAPKTNPLGSLGDHGSCDVSVRSWADCGRATRGLMLARDV